MANDTQICQSLAQFVTLTDLPMVDLRPAVEYQHSHIAGASHFEISQVQARLHQLPKKSDPIRIVVCSERANRIESELKAIGFSIEACYVWDDNTEASLRELGLLADGKESARLWQPAPFVESFCQEIAKDGSRGKALDIACGAGRDSVYLALQGWQVTALDYLQGALDKAADLAHSQQVTLETRLLDLEQNNAGLTQVEGQFDLILVVRYLHRPLLSQIQQKLAPGGYLLYQTFMQGCEAFGSPRNPRFLLKPGELAQTFSHLEIIYDEVEYLEDGRPTQVFVARMPG